LHRLRLHGRMNKDGIKVSKASIIEAVHSTNVWIRACRYNVVVMLDPDGIDIDDIADMLHGMGYPPPRAFLDAAPGAAKFGMKTAVAEHRPLMRQLLTAEERAGVVTPTDIEAERAFQLSSFMGHYDFLDGTGIFSPTQWGCSWVLWALDGIEAALHNVAWRGVPLSFPVPALLEPWQEAEWEDSRGSR
jgi:hypothetical protein